MKVPKRIRVTGVEEKGFGKRRRGEGCFDRLAVEGVVRQRGEGKGKAGGTAWWEKS